MVSTKQKNKAYEILKEYNGDNPYILMIKRQVENGDIKSINDFHTEYILDNREYVSKDINKIVKITRELGEKKKEAWNTEFIPEKLFITKLIGETKTSYNCYVKYRQSVGPVMTFLPKSGILTNFLITDYNNINVDFDRYDRLSKDRKLLIHQKEGVKFLLARKKCILADDMGSGKSCTLTVASIEGNFDSVVIICPASLKENWKRELMYYVPERDITIIDGILDKTKPELEKLLGYGVGKSGMKRDELLEEAKERGKWEDNRYVIVNYDILDEFYKIPKSWAKSSVTDAYNKSPLLQYITNKKSLLIIDEAHRLSKSSSIRYKVIKDLIKRGNPDSIYLATGTPITNNPLNLYCVLQLIENTITADYKYYMETYCGATTFLVKGEWKRCSDEYIATKNKTMWAELTKEEKKECNEYIEEHGKHITVAKEATNLDELREKLSPIYLRRTKEEFGDLPEKEIHEVLYVLFPEQRKKYRQLWNEYEETQLENDPTKELNKELLEGSIYRSYLSEEMIPYTIKLTNSFLKNDEKVIIACCFDKELYTLQDYYKDKCVVYNGKMSLKEKEKAIEKFMNDDTCKVFIGNIIASGVGITLTKSHRLIFNSFDYAYVNNVQMQDRIHRIGQTEKCDIYYQMFRDTQTENVWNITLRKQMIFNNVIKKESDK